MLLKHPITGEWVDMPGAEYYNLSNFDFKGPTINPPNFLASAPGKSDYAYNPGGIDFSTSPGFGIGFEDSINPIDNIGKPKRTSTATPKYGPTVANAKRLGAEATATAGTDAKAGAASKSRWVNPDGFFGNAENGIKGFYNKATNPQFDWSKEKGLTGWGKNLGTYANVGNALYQGYKAAESLQDLSDSRDSTEELMAKISAASHNSPTVQYDLSSDQLDLLRDIRGGNYDTDISLSDVDLLGALGDAGMGVVTGAAGGIPGMVIGAIGGLTNSILGDLNNTAGASNTELEALYQAILDSEQQYKQSRKQKAYARLGMGGY